MDGGRLPARPVELLGGDGDRAGVGDRELDGHRILRFGVGDRVGRRRSISLEQESIADRMASPEVFPKAPEWLAMGRPEIAYMLSLLSLEEIRVK